MIFYDLLQISMNKLNYTVIFFAFSFFLGPGIFQVQAYEMLDFEQKRCLNGNSPAISFKISGFDHTTNYEVYYGDVRLGSFKSTGQGVIHDSNVIANNAGCGQNQNFTIYRQNGGPQDPSSRVTTVAQSGMEMMQASYMLDDYIEVNCLNGNTPVISFSVSGFQPNRNYEVYLGHIRLNQFHADKQGVITVFNINANNAGCNQNLDLNFYTQNGGPSKPSSYLGNVDTDMRHPSLPIELSYFGAVATDDQIRLTWRTESEHNNDFIEIQRSYDGKTFEHIGTVKGHGNSNIPQEYTFADAAPLTGVNYYRLRQVDFDGQTKYHEVIAVLYKETTDKTQEITVFPTMVSDQLHITLKETLNTDAELYIIDLNGRILFETPCTRGTQQQGIFVNHLAKGAYLLTMKIGRHVKTARFIKQ